MTELQSESSLTVFSNKSMTRVDLPGELAARLAWYCEQTGMTPSAVIVDLLRDALPAPREFLAVCGG